MTRTRLQTILLPLGAAFVGVGFAAFFSAFVLGYGAYEPPSSFEWPVGLATGVATLDDGSHVVPIESASRVQIYDSEWNFIRGWQVDAAGGSFTVRGDRSGMIIVSAVRTDSSEVYDQTGNLVSSAPSAPDEWRPPKGGREVRLLLTKPYLFLLWSPFLGWLMYVVGGFAVAIATLGMSYATTAQLKRFGIVDVTPAGYSSPDYGLFLWLGLGIAATLAMASVVPNQLFKFSLLVIGVGNLVTVPRFLWGFEIRDGGVRVWYPFRLSGHAVLNRGQFLSHMPGPSHATFLVVSLDGGRALKLTALGTTRFGLLRDYVSGADEKTA